MTPQERLEAFWAGERPDQIPYTIYSWEWSNFPNDPAWVPMYDRGLLVTDPVPVASIRFKDVAFEEDTGGENGHSVRRQTMKSPWGELFATWRNGWHESYWLESPEDYAVLCNMFKHADVAVDHSALDRAQEAWGNHGIAFPAIGRTPLQVILVDYAGIENFGIQLLMFEDAVMEVYEILLDHFRTIVEATAEAKGTYVSCLENFTAETLGPDRYETFLLPVYQECFPMLHQAGKIVGTHYDGRLAACTQAVAKAPIDLIESLTPPPEGDLTLAEARAAWPDKLFWSNINVTSYKLEPAVLRDRVLDAVAQASPDGRRLAFEVSEQIPDNWRDSMPVVLDALEETRVSG